MSAFTPEAAQLERLTAVHADSSARILTIYVSTALADGQTETGFPVSGDMLAVLNRDTAEHAAYRRRAAAFTATASEARQ